MPFTLETAPPEILVETFADLLSDRFVFTPDYGSALDELIYNLPNDNVNAIASSIKTWCQARPDISDALENKLRKRGAIASSIKTWFKARPHIWEALEGELGQRGSAESVPSPRPEDYKTLLKNKLRDSFPKPVQKQSASSRQ
jgi:hypothetical protein